MAVEDAPRPADDIVVDGPPVEGLIIGAAWNASEQAVILTHDGDCVALPIETAIALRDALSVAIAIPDRARAMAAIE